MPLYEYQAIENGCEHCRDVFEVLQSINDAPLEKCPECGAPCRRLFSSFSSIKSTRDMLSAKNLSRCGLTQYKKAGGGYYEKTAGEGPSVINRDA
ncbi:MAG TPA: FmdB family transcriptional regulator [Planctomycetaceae bacterium]|nr:FmdB family transcriptional regulator [Planctomycetaceae bacterium]